MSDVVVSVTESTTTVAVTENAVNVAVTETPVVVSTATAGLQGASGAQGIGYANVTSTTSITIGSGLKTFTLDGSYAGAFVTGMRARAIHTDTPGYFVEGVATYVGGGTFIITVDKYNGSGSHNAWVFAVAGEIGQTGATGSTGATGATGAAGTGVPTGGTAGQVLAKIDATDYNTQWVNAASGTPNYALTAGTATYATASGSATVAGTAVTAGTAYFATTAGTATYATTSGTAVSISGSITNSQVSDFAAGTVTRGTANSLLTGDNSFIGQNTFTPTNSSSTALRVVGQASQGAILQDWRSSSASLASMGADGALTLPNASITGSGNANFATVTATAGADANKALIAKAFSATQSANIFEVQTSAGVVGSRFNSSGYFGTERLGVNANGATIPSSSMFFVQPSSIGNVGAIIRGAASQSGDLLQTQNSAGVVLGGRNAVGQIYTGNTAGLTTGVGGATLTATSTAGTATITTTSAHNIGSGDLVVVAGITPTGFNGTYVVTAVPSATAISYVNATSGPQTVAGTISVYAQTSIVSRSAATTGLVVKGATSQASNLQEWQNSGGTALATVSSAGAMRAGDNVYANALVGATGTALITNTTALVRIQANATLGGGWFQAVKVSSAPGSIATDSGQIYFVSGTNANTLKLVVKAGAGAQQTILDNIPTA